MGDTSDATVAAPETASPATKPAKALSRKSNIVLLLTIALLIVGTLFVLYKVEASAERAFSQKVVVLDTKKLMESSQKQIMDTKGLSNEQAIAVSEKLALNMKKLVGMYHDQGYTVINSGALLTWPDEIDITPQFAEQLGVKLE